MNNSPKQGRCLCGAVRFEVAQAPGEIGACHCGICRRWSGGAGITCVDTPGATLESADTLRWYRSSAQSERGFCGG